MTTQEKINYLLNNEADAKQRVNLLDQLTISIKENRADSKEANQIWNALKQNHYFWYFSPRILELSVVDDTKVFSLIILEDAIKHKWLALPDAQKQTIKTFIANMVMELGKSQNLPKTKQNILSKANSILVQIVKYQWNTTWTDFIYQICQASTQDMNVCENNFAILKMLSQQIFQYSKNQMTQQQITDLKKQMNKDFTTIYQLCQLVLKNSDKAKPSLIKACLETLNAFLAWIPVAYIVFTDLVQRLVSLLAFEYHRTAALQCLIEIASLPDDDNSMEFRSKQIVLLKNTTLELNRILPIKNKEEIPKFLQSIKRNQRQIFENLSRQIVLFYSQFFKNQYQWLKVSSIGEQQLINTCKLGFDYLNMLMQINQQSIFKIAIEFYHFFIGKYLQEKDKPLINVSVHHGEKPITLYSIYPQVFHEVMEVICTRMAKPEEVLIVIDEAGYPVREELEDTENSSLYQVMKELAFYLAAYDWPEMKKYILGQIQKQDGPDFNFDRLNSLSWIVGSLCGAIVEKEEKQFFIGTLRTLLHLCECKRGKQNKAVIASCIMYVVGQYPTFLRSNWSFLKTVIKKLFQFMKQQFPGIMDMACNAFLKIVKATADQFVIPQQNETIPYIYEIIQKIPQETRKLNNDALRLIFYQSIGYLIHAQKHQQQQIIMMKDTLGQHLFSFMNISASAQSNPNILKDEECEQRILYFLKINQNLAIGAGQHYWTMLQQIQETLSKLYMFYSSEVNLMFKNSGKNILNFLTVKNMRAIKKQIIRIYINYLQRCNNLNKQQADFILQRFIFPLGPLLKDFEDCPPQTKEQEFVMLFTLVLQKLSSVINSDFLSKLLTMIFNSSLPLITTDFNSFPEIRANFFAFLKALIKFNFNLLYSLHQSHFQTILNCVIWSFRHELSNYSDLGLQLIEEILNNVNQSFDTIRVFYPKYHIKLTTEILDVMTDGFHKSGLQSQANILYMLIRVVTQPNVLSNNLKQNTTGKSNAEFLYNFLAEKLSGAFSNLTKQETYQRVSSWFKQIQQKNFKLQIADYLVLINRFSVQDIKENVQNKENQK